MFFYDIHAYQQAGTSRNQEQIWRHMCLKITYIYDQFEVWSAMYRTDHIYVHVVKFELNVGKF
jgi:uncharacterized LabA/DUF88 family protein